MDEAIERIDYIIKKKGECVIGHIMETFLGYDRHILADELEERGYVVRKAASVKDGYVVYPKHKKRTEPWMTIQVI